MLVRDLTNHMMSMSPHLIPNKPHIKGRDGTGEEANNGSEEEKQASSEISGPDMPPSREAEGPEEGEDRSEVTEVSIAVPNHVSALDNQRRRQLQNLINSLECEMTEQLKNHKIFLEDIAKIESERNLYYGILRNVEDICAAAPDTPAKKEIQDILFEEPDEFKSVPVKKP